MDKTAEMTRTKVGLTFHFCKVQKSKRAHQHFKQVKMCLFCWLACFLCRILPGRESLFWQQFFSAQFPGDLRLQPVGYQTLECQLKHRKYRTAALLRSWARCFQNLNVRWVFIIHLSQNREISVACWTHQ